MNNTDQQGWFRQAMRYLALAAFIAPLLAMSGCASKKSLDGGASDNGGGAEFHLGLPF